MKTEKLNCPVCDIEITGAGNENLKKNVTLHLLNEHRILFHDIVWDENFNVKVKTAKKKVKNDIKKKEDAVDKVEKKVSNKEITEKDYVKMSKDELLDFSAQQGLTDEVKYSWKKSKIIAALKKLIK